MDATGSPSKSPAKRAPTAPKRAREGQLVAMQISCMTPGEVFCSVASFDDQFTPEVLDKMAMSLPSEREGLYGFDDEGALDPYLWTEEKKVHHLTDVARIVVMYYDE